MNHARTFRMLVGGLATTLLVGTVGVGAAEARPTKPGGVPNLKGTPTWHSGTTYDVDATWGSVARATGYRASLIKGGITVASTTLTGLEWDPTVVSGPGQVTLQVQAVIGHHKGTPAKVTVVLPDKVAPTGQFASTKVDGTKTGTITQLALNDDSGVAGIARTVNWGDGLPDAPWSVGSTIDYHYAAIGRYVPTVTVTDVAGNSVTYTLNAIVLGDVTAPTGSVSVSPSSAWATLDHVVATPGGLSDDVSPSADIKVSVDWGDGTSTDSTGSAAVNHVYAVAGTYDVVPTITDEAGNPTTLAGHSVTVSADKVAPLVKLLLPTWHRHSVKVWKLLRGKATDTNGTGVRLVHVRAVEKRGTRWFGYRPVTKTWVKAATKALAFKRARAFSRTTDARHRWSATLVGLRKGTLVYKVWAVDRVRNGSRPLTHKATLTKP